MPWHDARYATNKSFPSTEAISLRGDESGATSGSNVEMTKTTYGDSLSSTELLVPDHPTQLIRRVILVAPVGRIRIRPGPSVRLRRIIER